MQTIYKPLLPRQFRVIRISPRIPLTLETNSLDDAVRYVALSYCWEDPPRRQHDPPGIKHPRTIATGPEPEAARQEFMITDNLKNALDTFIATSEERLIFIDQLCINQDDIAERAEQVKQMAEIYELSETVFAWLGLSSAASHQYMKFVEHLSGNSDNILEDLLQLTQTEFFKLNDELSTNSAAAQDDGHQLRAQIADSVKRWNESIRAHLDGLLHILGRQWFSRLWIVQEACLGQKTVFMCGADRAAMEDFRASYYFVLLCLSYGVNQLRYNPFSLHDTAVRLKSLTPRFNTLLSTRQKAQRALLDEKPQRNSLLQLVKFFGVNDGNEKIGATDDRDRIFSLLGLAAQDDSVRQETIAELSYDKSLQHLYTSFAAKAMRQDVDTLVFSQFGDKRLDGLPSWVPDWKMPLKLPHGYYSIEMRAFVAGGPKRGAPRLSAPIDDKKPESTCLVVSGFTVGAIIEVGSEKLKMDDDPSRTKAYPWITYVLQILAKKSDMSKEPQVLDTKSVDLFLAEARDFVRRASSIPADSQPQETVTPDGKIGAKNRAYLRLSTGGLFLRPEPIDYQELQLAHDELVADVKRQLQPKQDHELQTRPKSSSPVIHFARSALYVIPSTVWNTIGFFGRLSLPIAIYLLHQLFEIFIQLLRLWRWSRGSSGGSFGPSTRGLPNARAARARNKIEYKLKLLQRCVGRRLFLTDSEGHVGLAPDSVRTGDVIVVLFGSSVPHALRRTEVGYCYVGEVYCDGIMEGEFLDASRYKEQVEFCIA